MKLSQFVADLRKGWNPSEILAFEAMVRIETAVSRNVPVVSTTVELPEPALSGELSALIAEMELQLDDHFQNIETRRLRILDVQIENRFSTSKKIRRLSRRRKSRSAVMRKVRRTRHDDLVLS